MVRFVIVVIKIFYTLSRTVNDYYLAKHILTISVIRYELLFWEFMVHQKLGIRIRCSLYLGVLLTERWELVHYKYRILTYSFSLDTTQVRAIGTQYIYLIPTNYVS